MSGKTMRDLLVDMMHNQHKKVAAFMPYIADLLRAAPVVECQPRAIHQVEYLGEGGGGWFDVEKEDFNRDNLGISNYRTRTVFDAPPELAELQATIERLTAENDEHEWHQMMTQLEDQNAEFRAEIERLKGGQGEPVAWQYKEYVWATGLGSHVWRDKLETEKPSDDSEIKDLTPLYASKPAPVSSELVRLLTRARIYARGEFRDEIDACLSGKPAPVSVDLDERAEFERTFPHLDHARCSHEDWADQYEDVKVGNIWIGWQARACLDKVKELNQ